MNTVQEVRGLVTRTLVLWDVDMTLVSYPDLGARWYERIVEQVLGLPFAGPPSFPGRTERGIVTELLRAHGVDVTEDRIHTMYEAILQVSAADAATLHERGEALPGAASVLAAVAAHPEMEQTLVTGNLLEIARHKLAAFGLDRHLDLGLGGYGEVSVDRSALIGAAVKAVADGRGREFPPEAVTVVGDTPADVRGALDHGARAVAVTTGRFGADELHAAGAHTVLPDLSDTARVLKALRKPKATPCRRG